MPPPSNLFDPNSTTTMVYPNTDKPKKNVEMKKKSSSGLSFIEGSHA
jgi:hypothetical protein